MTITQKKKLFFLSVLEAKLRRVDGHLKFGSLLLNNVDSKVQDGRRYNICQVQYRFFNYIHSVMTRKTFKLLL